MAFDLEEWYRMYHRDVLRFLEYNVRNHQEAEDLLQEVFVRMMNSHSDFRGDSSAKTWVLAITRNVYRDWQRKRVRLFKWFTGQEVDQKEMDRSVDIEMSFVEADERMSLYQHLRKLKPDYRDVVVLRYIHELSTEETAEVLGFSSAKVRVTLHRALKELEKRMADDPAFHHFKKGVTQHG